MELDNRSTKGQADNGPRGKAATASKPGGKTVKNSKPSKASDRPGWASGLRQLYDAVVEEPLPDSFNDLIARLDSKS